MHTSPDVLALVALGEDAIDDGGRRHLDSCPICQSELAELTRAAQLGRGTTPNDVIHSPSPRVWLAIRDELGLSRSASLTSAPLTSASLTTVPTPAPVATPPPAAGSAGRWRHGRLVVAVLAAAVALFAGFGIGLNWNRLTAPNQVADATVNLNALPAWPGSSGTASIETDAGGHRFLVVRVNADPAPAGGRQEVWMSDTLALHMTSMGFLTNGQGRFAIPPTMNPKDSPLVDVSEEPPNDTDPGHSHNSIVRGRLPV
jgi:anti-sigma-K factor RskA